jgi:1-acyl-sn-glycerol-3-phosphate acyltransferase
VTGHAPPLVRAPDTQTVLYRLVAAFCKPVVRILFRPDMRGLEHIPQGGFVFSSNQLSNLDGFLAYAIYPRQLRWTGKAELFQPLFKPVLRLLGIFPVRRGMGDLDAVATAVELAGEGHVVGIFPEGTRRSKGLHKKRQAQPHTGAARVALAAGVFLVPAAVGGTDRLLLLRKCLLRKWRLAPMRGGRTPFPPYRAADAARAWSTVRDSIRPRTPQIGNGGAAVTTSARAAERRRRVGTSSASVGRCRATGTH